MTKEQLLNDKKASKTMVKLEHIEGLYLLLATPVLLAAAYFFKNWRKKTIQKMGEPQAVGRLISNFSEKKFWQKIALAAAAAALLAIAFANPQGEGKRQKVKQKSADILLAIDISQSMLAEDLAPSRLERARVFAQKLVKNLPGQRVGLIFFAGNAYLQMPLSTDAEAAISMLKSADPTMVSEQGTAIAQVIELAQKSFDQKIPAGKAIVILTDGETHDSEAVARAESARDEGITTFAVGVGTAAGAPIPIGVGAGGLAYKRDAAGETVTSKLDEKMLRDLAEAGGGQAFLLQNEAQSLDGLREALDKLEKQEVEARSVTDFEAYFQWFLLPAILFLILEIWLPVLSRFFKF